MQAVAIIYLILLWVIAVQLGVERKAKGPHVLLLIGLGATLAIGRLT